MTRQYLAKVGGCHCSLLPFHKSTEMTEKERVQITRTTTTTTTTPIYFRRKAVKPKVFIEKDGERRRKEEKGSRHGISNGENNSISHRLAWQYLSLVMRWREKNERDSDRKDEQREREREEKRK